MSLQASKRQKDEQGAKPGGNKSKPSSCLLTPRTIVLHQISQRPCGGTIPYPDRPESKTKNSSETMRQTPQLLEFHLSQDFNDCRGNGFGVKHLVQTELPGHRCFEAPGPRCLGR
ncbi:hypothetical protein AV530_004654 [Patagioenas fasciata monilis]|uniref:Uncharacterized protein n=1 Tax=Patagioenas fasciata monilis TaxID=372326 RepID=A0A1V4KHS1_PATFA|nr:hypothetical protein AV530_004654 [Patagioenas fasciata monilis]